jgi:SSS family solute:Na+ symporter
MLLVVWLVDASRELIPAVFQQSPIPVVGPPPDQQSGASQFGFAVITAIVVVVAFTYLMTFGGTRQIFALGTWCFSGYAGLFPLLIAALYWRRVTAPAAFAAIAVTGAAWLAMFVAADFGANRKFLVAGMLPVAALVVLCTVTLVVVSLLTRPPPERILAKFFPLKSS